MLKNLLNAGNSPNLEFAYDFLYIIPQNYVKIAKTRRQSAGVRSISTSEASQRLHAGDLTLNPRSRFTFSFNYFSNIKIFFKPYSVQCISTKVFSLPPAYVSGFSDGESSFHVSVLSKKGYKMGFQIIPIFTIQLHIKDLDLLKKIQSFFGVGVIIIKKNTKKEPTSAIFSVQSLNDIISVIIPHFDKYPLITKKKADYLLFKKVIDVMAKGGHLTKEGLEKIVSIKASMNKGLNETLKLEFPSITPVLRPEINVSPSLEVHYNDFPNWLAGFVEAEGCFLCLIRKNVGHLIGYQVTLSFSLCQHARDLDLMLKIKEYLGFGIISQDSSVVDETRVPGVVRLTVTKKSDIDTLISFFENYMLIGSKRLNLEDFSKIQVMVNNNLHKTEAGLNKIRFIKDGMNKNRKDGNEKI